MDRIINKAATIQKVSEWSQRHKIEIENFETLMARGDWEDSLKEIARGCSVEVVYYKRLSEVNPKSGEWFSILANPFAEERSVVLIKENGIAELSWTTRKTEAVFDPQQLMKEQAKEQLKIEIEKLTEKANSCSIGGKEFVTPILANMKKFYQKHFEN